MTSARTLSESRTLPTRDVLPVMAGLFAALFTAMISNTIVSTALPTIMADLDGTQRQYTWVITTSLLMMTISTPIWGKLSDLFDKKKLVLTAIVLFVLGSMTAGLSISVGMMMAARVIQGTAMGGLVALVQSIMGTILSPRERGKYSGYMGMVMGVATVSGPFLGGVITDEFGWRWTYYICVPLAIIAVFLVQTRLRMPDIGPRDVSIDYGGAVLIPISAALPMLWVTFAGSSFEWVSWQSGAFVGGFLISTVLAIIVELRVKEPIVPMRVLGNRTAVMMIVASVAIGVAMFSPAIFLTQYFQLGQGSTPTQAGLLILPMIICQTISSVAGGIIVTRTGRWKALIVVGAVFMVSGLFGLGTVDHNTAYLPTAIAMAFTGAGVGLLIQNTVLVVQNTVDVTEVGAASAAIAFFRSLGGSVGVAALGALLTSQVAAKIQEGVSALGLDSPATADSQETNLDLSGLPGPVQDVVHESYADAFGNLFLIVAAVSVIALIAILAVRATPLRTTIALETTEGEAAGAEQNGSMEPVAASRQRTRVPSGAVDTGGE